MACVCSPAETRLFAVPRSAPGIGVPLASSTATFSDPLERRPSCSDCSLSSASSSVSSPSASSSSSSLAAARHKLPDGVELTLGELQEMATRQQHQIDSQHQLLAAKEQRLRYLKQQEARHQQVAAENERLRRLRDRVEAQELKLRKLRALRGQVDQNKLNNASLTSDLDSIRALFNEKEKELSVAVAKVEELTRQLEELRRGRGARDQQATAPSPASLELDKLRRELMCRNKLNEQQNARLSQQREVLSQKQEEMSSIDKRISELQDRLHRKRLLNQQLANQINAASNKAAVLASQQAPLRSAASATTIQQHAALQQQQQQQQQQPGKGKLLRPLTSSNIAAVEPYHHVPVGENEKHRHGNNAAFSTQKQQLPPYPGKPPYHQPEVVQDDFHAKLISGGGNTGSTHNGNATTKLLLDKDDQFLPEFGGSKSDPKYQTLPYNTKFTVNFVSSVGTKVGGSEKQDPVTADDVRKNSDSNEVVKNNINNMNNNANHNNNNNNNNNPSQHLMTVHSIPIPALSSANKGLATPLSNQGQHHAEYQQQQQPKIPASHMLGHLAPSVRAYGPSHPAYVNPVLQPGLTRGQPVGGSSSTTSSTSSLATNSSSSSSGGQQAAVATGGSTTLHVPTSIKGSKPVGYGVLLPPTPLTLANQKPVSSVAPTSVQHQKPSPIYQTSSTKIHPVQPQTLSSTPQGILRDLRGELSPPQGSSTPLGTPDSYVSSQDSRVGKPALPPKPALPVKPTPPPRQTHHMVGAESDVDSAVLRSGVRLGLPFQEHLPPKTSHHQQNSHHTGLQSELNDGPPPPPPPLSEPPDDGINSNVFSSQRRTGGVGGNSDALPIKARPLTIKKQPVSEHPKLKSSGSSGCIASSVPSGVHVTINRRIEMPPAFFFPETEAPPADLVSSSDQSTFSPNQSGGTSNQNCVESIGGSSTDDVDRAVDDKVIAVTELDNNNVRGPIIGEESSKPNKDDGKVETLVDSLNNVNSNQDQQFTDGGSLNVQHVTRRSMKKGNLKGGAGSGKGGPRRVSFDPLALLLDASLEGELELVRKTAGQVANPSAANDEGITALHNAICAGHLDIVMFLVEFGCDVNAQDSDGWTPLHCAASCNNLAMVKFLVEHGACIFATTLSDHETAAEKCEEDEEGFDGCSEYLYSVQEKLGILNGGVVYAVYDYEAHNSDELSFKEGDRLVVLRKGDEWEREWWWSRLDDREGYVPRNLLGLYSRVHPSKKSE